MPASLHIVDFQQLYADIYDHYEDLRPYWIGIFAFAEALVVSNLASGRPRLQPLREALDTIGTMRNLEREGRLVLTETPEGTTISLAEADDDEAAPT